MFLTDVPHNRGLVPFDGTPRSHLSPKQPFLVTHLSPVLSPKQFWFLAPGVLVYPEAMIGDDPCDSPYYCWAYHAELLSVSSPTDDFRAINTERTYPHPETGFEFDLRSTYPLFRISGEPLDQLFCLEGCMVESDGLMATYNHHGLSGLVFEEVYAW
ncbi:MAG: hypothetical protein JNJ83_20725 [Verrucomicrobiaceae bacterium]|nr:hypothetical protein [Verrucomicrobiaceae bacterium]